MGSKGLQVNRSEISRLYGVSLTTVDGWVSRGCPSKKINTGWEFNTADVWKWLQQEAVKTAQGEIEKLKIDEIRKRKVAAETALIELDLAKQRGELVLASHVEKAGIDSYSACRAKLLSLPIKLSPLVVASSDVHEVRAMLEKEIYQALNELGQYEQLPFDEGEPSEDREAQGDLEEITTSTLKADSKPVGRPRTKVKPRSKR